MADLAIPAVADIVIVDGGSTDGSLETEKLTQRGVRGLLVKTGPGRLSAQLRCAYAFALDQGYEGIVTIDGNDKDDPEAIPRFVAALEEGVDFVQASRFIEGGVAEGTPRSRDIAIRWIHAPLLRLASGFPWTDTTQGFRAYSRRLLLDPRVQPFRDVFATYELLAYMSYRAPRIGYRCVELPTTRRYPAGETPTKISGVKGNLSILAILVRTARGRFDPPPTTPIARHGEETGGQRPKAGRAQPRPVTLLAPAYNEEAVIEDFVKQATAILQPEWRLMVVDDGSQDRTAQILRELENSEPRLQVVSHDGNQGLGTALATGFRAAPKGIVVTMDADLSHPFGLIGDLVEGCSRSDAVFASRYVAGGGMEGVPRFRVVISQVANGLMRVLFGTRVRDLTTGFRAYRTDMVALDRIEAKRFDAQLEISIRLIADGREIAEVPLILKTRQAGESKMSYLRLVKPYSRTVLRMLILRWLGIGR